MTKNEQKYNKTGAYRLKSLLGEKKISQKQLTEMIKEATGSTISQQHISQVITGKVRLTEALAHDIARVFPEKNLLYEWLMGEVDHASIIESLVDSLQQADYEASTLLLGFTAFLELTDYEIYLLPSMHPIFETVSYKSDNKNTAVKVTQKGIKPKASGNVMIIENNAPDIVDYLHNIKKRYLIKHGEEEYILSLEEMNLLLNRLFNLFEVYINDYFKKPVSFQVNDDGKLEHTHTLEVSKDKIAIYKK